MKNDYCLWAGCLSALLEPGEHENKRCFSEKLIVRENTMNYLKRFIRDERGLETVEWAVIAALIVAGLVLVIKELGTNVEARFGDLRDATVKPGT